MTIRKAVLAIAATMTIATAASAQETLNATDTQTGDEVTVREQEDDKDFPWGLLGLLGLAGLLGRKKNDRDIHVDARHNTDRTTTTTDRR